jgi:hypothetical protein
MLSNKEVVLRLILLLSFSKLIFTCNFKVVNIKYIGLLYSVYNKYVWSCTFVEKFIFSYSMLAKQQQFKNTVYVYMKIK